MLSIAPLSGNLDYYLELATTEYYLKGGEPEGRWCGLGAKSLGLQGNVSPDNLRHLAAGFSSDGKQKLVQNAGSANRQIGWDFTFSAPKSVSLLWSVSDGNIRSQTARAHAKAVQKAIGYLEQEAAASRVGKAGEKLTRAGLVAATFEHGTSRANDPQLHTHALILNLGVDSAGKTRTIISRPLYKQKMTAEVLENKPLT